MEYSCLTGIFWNLCHYRETCGYASIGNMILSVVLGNISEVHSIVESCFTVIRMVDNLSNFCHLMLKVCHDCRYLPRNTRVGRESRICSIEDGYVFVIDGNLVP